jgi:hypothetical protein
MGAETQRSPAADRAATVTCSLAKTSTTKHSTHPQIFNIDGERLANRRPRLICGAPRLASPSWYRLAADRWQEVAR